MYDIAFHKTIENDEIPQAKRLAQYISEYIKPSCCIDFGCSTGIYVKELQAYIPVSMGLEFSSDAVKNAVCPNIVQADLTTPFSLELPESKDRLGICLEVLEHIEDSQSKQVLQNVVNNCDRLIFSAALPGQGGVGHINCRPKIDWIKRFHELGWVVDLDATRHLLHYIQKGYHLGWLANNVIVLIPYKS